jgi:hypothetical protein
MKQRGGEILVLLALLGLLAFVGVQMLRPPADGKEETPHRTTYSAKPTGWKALYRLVEKRGYKVTRAQNAIPFYLTQSKPSVLIVGPEYSAGFMQSNDWTKKEAEATKKWVESGGNLIIISGRETELTKVWEFAGMSNSANKAEKTEKEGKADLFSPTQPAPFFDNVRFLTLPIANAITVEGSTLPLVISNNKTQKNKTQVVMFTRGKGRVLWIGSSGMADNAHLDKTDNARFLDQYLRSVATTGATVAFDEFHQGKQTEESFWSYLGKAGQSVVCQLVGVVLLAGYSAALRFGLPRPLPRTSRVSAEYVGSVADLYRRAGATDLVLTTLYDQFWRDLCRTVDREPDANVTEVIRRAARLTARDKDQVGQYEERIGRLIVACKEQVSQTDPKVKLKEATMLHWVQEIESLRTLLQIERRIG